MTRAERERVNPEETVPEGTLGLEGNPIMEGIRAPEGNHAPNGIPVPAGSPVPDRNHTPEGTPALEEAHAPEGNTAPEQETASPTCGMEIDILTLFPEAVDAMMGSSILGRAQSRGYIAIRTHQIRAWTTNKQMQVDDYPYGGGRGAVMQADPLYRCWNHVIEACGPGRTIFLSPCGRTFTQEIARELVSRWKHLVLVCGHYEGVDQRFLDECVDEELSIGDYVLTGGEIPAMAVSDAVCRLVPGVLPGPECYEEESHWDGLLEYPQYSRPAVWHGREVPPVLVSGDHGKVAAWRRKESYVRTMLRRPDMFACFDESRLTTRAERKVLQEAKEEASRLQEAVRNRNETEQAETKQAGPEPKETEQAETEQAGPEPKETEQAETEQAGPEQTETEPRETEQAGMEQAEAGQAGTEPREERK